MLSRVHASHGTALFSLDTIESDSLLSLQVKPFSKYASPRLWYLWFGHSVPFEVEGTSCDKIQRQWVLAGLYQPLTLKYKHC